MPLATLGRSGQCEELEQNEKGPSFAGKPGPASLRCDPIDRRSRLVNSAARGAGRSRPAGEEGRRRRRLAAAGGAGGGEARMARRRRRRCDRHRRAPAAHAAPAGAAVVAIGRAMPRPSLIPCRARSGRSGSPARPDGPRAHRARGQTHVGGRGWSGAGGRPRRARRRACLREGRAASRPGV